MVVVRGVAYEIEIGEEAVRPSAGGAGDGTAKAGAIGRVELMELSGKWEGS